MVPIPFRARGAARLIILLEYFSADEGVSLKSPIATMLFHPQTIRESVISESLSMAMSLLHEELAPYFDGW